MSGEDYSVYEHDPDMLVDWNLVEEVRLHMSAATDCPICLHPPIAAKVIFLLFYSIIYQDLILIKLSIIIANLKKKIIF